MSLFKVKWLQNIIVFPVIAYTCSFLQMIMSQNSCPLCKTFVSTALGAIQCTLCELFFHQGCTDFVYTALESNWCCQLCMLSVFPFKCVEDEQDFIDTTPSFACSSFVKSKKVEQLLFDPTEHYEEGRALLMDPNVDADFNFYNSFIHFCSAPSSPLLLRGAPDYSTDTVSQFHAEAHRQLQVKDLPKVPTWRLERESNPRPSGCE